MARTRIAWTDFSLNPGIYGCSPVHSGCDHCYAATMARRLAGMGQDQYAGLTTPGGRWTGEVRVNYSTIGAAFAKLPTHKRASVFVTSMGDLFHTRVPGEFIGCVFDEMVDRPNLTFQLLTKRPGRVAFAYARRPHAFPLNVWLGVSCSTQADVDRMVPDLMRVPAAVRFVSLEPLLGPVKLNLGICWAIIGCESGPHRRPCSLEWVRSVVCQCQRADVPVFVKQLDLGGRVSRDPAEWPLDLRVQEFPG